MRLLIFFLVIFVIFWRYQTTRPAYKNGQRLRLTGIVRQEPFRYSYYQKIYLADLKIYLPKFPEINYGDKVVIEGVVANGELGNAFLVKKEEVKSFLSGLRVKIINFFKQSLPEPHAALVAGISLGAKGSLPQPLWQNLQKTGTAHVVVASGLNVSLVAGFLVETAILFIRRRQALALGLIGVWLYALLSGFAAPIIRAAIMASIAFFALETGRLYSAWRGLVIAGLIMLVIVPDWLTDLGFILSFVATASILAFKKRIDQIFAFLPDVLGLKKDFTTSLAAQIGVGPILFATFSQFNLLSPLVNGLALWTIPPITVLGLVGGLTGLIFPLLGRGILLLTLPLTVFFSGIVKLFG